MDEHYFMIAIRALGQKIDTLEYMRADLEAENAALREQLSKLCSNILTGKDGE